MKKITIIVATLLCMSTGASHAYSLLRASVIEFYGASHAAQDAIAFDVCLNDGPYDRETARENWLNRRGKRAYDRVMVRLKRAYLADPRDAAVEQVHKDFCDAVKHRRAAQVRYN
jgi:hypothetical protein